MNASKKIKTILYGGAFNPPTLAHVAILRACFEHAEQIGAQVWVLPSGNRKDKVIPIARTKRLQYITALCHDAARSPRDQASIITAELDRTIPVETIDTLHELQTAHPDRAFIFVFGADSTETMAEWKGGDELLRTLPMLVIERQGSLVNPRAIHATLLSVHPPVVSSTEVRHRLATGESIEGLVSSGVAQLLA